MKYNIQPHAETNEGILNKFRALSEVYSLSCIVTDAQERCNVMSSRIVSRSVNRRVIGPAVTVKLTPGDIVDCLCVFEVCRPGDVVVIDAFGESETSIWGGLMSGLARAAGIAGVVIDGSARDIDEAKMLDFPIYAASVSPRAAHTAYSGRREPIEVNVPIVCGGILVKPGDLVVADEVGVVTAPAEALDEIYIKVKEQADKEAATRADILKGATVEELLAKYGRI